MAYILNIETSGKNCSVALAKDDKVITLKEVKSEQFVHAEQLHLLIEEALSDSNLAPSDLSCVAVAAGPGSYTGLRIGVASAKGLAYGLGIPLVSVSSLMVLANTARKISTSNYLVPMIDARRMEVYTAIYNQKLIELRAARPVIVDESFLSDFLNKEAVVFGDGAEKCLDYTGASEYVEGVGASAQFMAEISAEKFQRNDFVDLAYFEPNYLKEFQAGKPKNMFL
jgi:tRNA threonylcarbamoyladenosine biosynthesis protein TsaB